MSRFNASPSLQERDLYEFEVPIVDAVRQYNDIAEGAITFSPVQASILEITPDKPNSARSLTPVYVGEDEIATLYTIAFAPHDGTGDENTYRATDLQFSRRYPAAAHTVPRTKSGIDCEVHLALVAKDLERRFADPKLFAANLDLLGFPAPGNTVDKIGTLGQPHDLFTNAIDTEWQPEPVVTVTTGVPETADPATGERYGDPHAVFNRWSTVVQIAGFIALKSGASMQHREALSTLGVDRTLLGLQPQQL